MHTCVHLEIEGLEESFLLVCFLQMEQLLLLRLRLRRNTRVDGPSRRSPRSAINRSAEKSANASLVVQSWATERRAALSYFDISQKSRPYCTIFSLWWPGELPPLLTLYTS